MLLFYVIKDMEQNSGDASGKARQTRPCNALSCFEASAAMQKQEQSDEAARRSPAASVAILRNIDKLPNYQNIFPNRTARRFLIRKASKSHF
ncbi:hypothetical protein AC739_02975 [Planococcus glaciei]|nr:hypothetical protein AC739_02975 [Planococcus glaciei]